MKKRIHKKINRLNRISRRYNLPRYNSSVVVEEKLNILPPFEQSQPRRRMKIGFIGLGNMGGAIAQSMADLDIEVFLSNHNPEKAQAIASKLPNAILAPNIQIVAECQVIFLGVKPNQLGKLLGELKEVMQLNENTLWISMAAGITLAQLSTALPSTAGIIRMMPNTPVAIGEGMTTYSIHTSGREDIDQQIFEVLMSNSGQIICLPEYQLDAATGLAGCGPAFVYQFIEALADAGVQNGLYRAQALELASQTVAGSGRMVIETKEHPAVLRDQVTSPGGSTIAGVVELEKKGFRSAAISAVNAAIQKTQTLGK